MKKGLFALTGTLLLLAIFAGTSLARESGSGVRGRGGAPPAMLAVTAPVAGTPALDADRDYGFYLWLDGDRLQLRTTDRGNGPGPSIYTGAITSDGTFGDARLIRDEAGDWAVAAGHGIDFHFTTFSAVDGVSFTVAGATQITFRLYRNGHLIRTDHIFIGPGQVTPPGNPFRVLL